MRRLNGQLVKAQRGVKWIKRDILLSSGELSVSQRARVSDEVDPLVSRSVKRGAVARSCGEM